MRYNEFFVNGIKWSIKFVPFYDQKLRRSDGVHVLGSTDNIKKVTLIADNLSVEMTRKVLSHEMVHVFCFSYGVHMDIETEEIVADFLSLYGSEVIAMVDEMLALVPAYGKMAYRKHL